MPIFTVFIYLIRQEYKNICHISLFITLESAQANTMDWTIYILKCADDSLYTGVAKNVEKRLHEHNFDDKKAAKYTRSRRPVTLVFSERVKTRSAALKRELQIKSLTRSQKQKLIGD